MNVVQFSYALRFSAMLSCLLALSGCGGGGTVYSNALPGQYEGDTRSAKNQTSSHLLLSLDQQGNYLTGTAKLTATGLSVEGSLTGSAISTNGVNVTISFPQFGTMQITGTLNNDTLNIQYIRQLTDGETTDSGSAALSRIIPSNSNDN